MEKNILLISSGTFHPSLLARRRLAGCLHELPGYKFHKISSPNKILNLSLEKYDALVLYYHRKKINPGALDAFDRYVSQGGGVLAIHSASASYKNEDRYFEVLGGRFKEHGPIQEYHVYPEITPDSIFGEQSPFIIKDELYLHELEPGNYVHFFAVIDGKTEPIVWTRRYGNGRVCYMAPGHTSGTMSNPAVQKLLQRGLQWSSREISNGEIVNE